MTNNNSQSRDSRFELLRICSMLCIILLHCLSHGGLSETIEFASAEYFIISCLRYFAYLGVNCFVLISGYFLWKKSNILISILKIEKQVLTYSIFIMIIYFTLCNGAFSFEGILACLTPIVSGKYWFASVYILLLIMLPIINKFICMLKQKDHLKIILIMLFLFCIVPTFFVWSKNVLSDGKDIFWFITLFLIGSFLSKNEIKIKISTKLIGICMCMAINVIGEYCLLSLSGRVGLPYTKFLFYNNSPFVLMGGVLTFLVFRDLKISSIRIINIVGKTTFGVYLFHDNELVRESLWKIVDLPGFMLSYKLPICLVYMICVVFCIFAIGVIIEFTRSKISDVIGIEVKLNLILENRFDLIVDKIIKDLKL